MKNVQKKFVCMLFYFVSIGLFLPFGANAEVAEVPFVNSGFETGDFTGWFYGDNGLPALNPWMVSTSTSSTSYPFDPSGEGSLVALNGFDGEAGYEAFLYQDIIVPAEATSLTFQDRIVYDGMGIPSSLPRIYEVQVRDTNNIILEVLHHQEVMLNNQPFTDLGWQQRTFNLSQYAGQMVRIYINLYVPESFTGPAQIEFDNFLFTNDSVNTQPVENFVNKGFETGDFTGWLYGDNGLQAFTPWMVASPTSSFLFPVEPVEGSFVALNGFDGEAGYEAFLYQDIVVPLDATTLTFYDRIIYDGGMPDSLPRIYEVQVRDTNNVILEVLHHQEVMLSNQPFTDLGWQQRTFNLSQYAGQMVRIYINLYVPESFTGPAQIEFDNFTFTNAPICSEPIVPGVSGCLKLNGIPLANRIVEIFPMPLPPMETLTDNNGCYSFPTITDDVTFDIIIKNP